VFCGPVTQITILQCVSEIDIVHSRNVSGGPGSGKGTQCEMIHGKYRYTHLSSGELLRDEVMTNSARGMQIFATMEKGILVPDEAVIDLLAEAMAKESSGFLVDGFPATIEQAQLFEKTVGSPVKIIVFEMKDDLMRVRLEGRGNFDDQKEAIKKRIDNYNEGTKPVIQAYSKLVQTVNADQSKEAVFSEVCKILDS